MLGPSDGSAQEDATIDAMSGMDGAIGMDAGPCPPTMAYVQTDGGVCVDLYEGALVRTLADGGEVLWEFFKDIDNVDASIRAVPANAIFPQGYISQVQATAACKAAGKRLCTLEEWTAACRGRPSQDFIYPYGDAYDKTACNEGRASPIPRLFPNPTYSYQELNDPRCNQLDGGLAHGGDFPKC
jgi:sulfatase modifying factor 1